MKEPNRQRKNEIKFDFTLDEGQKKVKEGVYNHDVNIVLGEFGSGKTACAAQIALDLLFKKHIDKIIITRPIDFTATGYLTGSMAEKLSYHLFPLMQNFYACYKREVIDKLVSEKAIEVFPINYMKGMTFTNCCTIVDEFEDITFEDFKLILTRLGRDSKLIFTGSESQIGVKNSCIPKIKCLKDCPEVGYHVLQGQHRNLAIQSILDFIDNAK